MSVGMSSRSSERVESETHLNADEQAGAVWLLRAVAQRCASCSTWPRRSLPQSGAHPCRCCRNLFSPGAMPGVKQSGQEDAGCAGKQGESWI